MEKFIRRLAACLQKKDLFRINGQLEVRDHRTGEILLVKDNLITNLGLALVAFQLGDGSTELTSACIGEGSTTAAYTDTALTSQVDAQTVTFTRIQTNVANDTAQFVSVHTAPSGGWAITEYGIKTTGGTLFNHVVFAAINLAEDAQLEFTYKVTIQRV